MASPGGRKSPAVIDRLLSEPYGFDFFQAVRLLEWWARRQSEQDRARPRTPVGYDGSPEREVARFRAHQSHSFPPGTISRAALLNEDSAPPLPELTVAFLGLTGPSGVLPYHYTTLVIDRIRERDFALRDFFDLFNHRAVSLFYRAWEKYRFPIGYERAKLAPARRSPDPFTQTLFCLTGWGIPQVRSRLDISDEAFLLYAGHFSHFPRSALGLESVAADYFDLPVEIRQFQGQWLYLADEEQSQLPTAGHPDGLNCALGRTAIVGERVWSIENSFRVRLGPLNYADFRRFVPDGDALQPLGQLVRSYVGVEYDFDVQLVLRKEEVPQCRLGGPPQDGSRLGWNTWLHGQPLRHNADDAVFQHDGCPSSLVNRN